MAADRARLFITQIIQGGGLRNVQNPFGGSARARARGRLGGGGIEVPEPPAIIEVPFVVDEQPAIIEVPFVVDEQPAIIEVPFVVDEQNIVDEAGDIGSFEDREDDETPNVTGEIKDLRVQLEAAKMELSTIVLADSFWLTALEEVLLEKLPFECDPLEVNALKELVVEKFKTKWHSDPMLDFEYIFQKMVSRGTGSDFIVLERSEGKAYFKLVEEELQQQFLTNTLGVYGKVSNLGFKLQHLTQELKKLAERVLYTAISHTHFNKENRCF